MAPPNKRKGLADTATPSPLPISKRARYEASSKSDEEKAWEQIVQKIHADDASNIIATPSSPAAPSFIFSEPSIANTSRTSRTSKREKKFVCDYDGCGKAFDRPVRLQAHVRGHTNERPYVCEEEGCEKSFLRSEHLKAHVKLKHSDERSHVCTYMIEEELECGKTFHTATRLKRHVAAHEEKEQTKCQEPGCGKMFRKQETLQRHIKTDHLQEKAFRCATHVNDIGDPDEECGETFATVGQLKGHQSREHSGFRYFCDTCSPPDHDREDGNTFDLSSLISECQRLGFLTYADLQHHIKTAHPPTCNSCGMQCASNRALKAHMDIEHASPETKHRAMKVGTYPCTWPSCDRSFTKSGNLKVHFQNVHAKARPFVCGEFDLSSTGSGKIVGWDGQGCGKALGTKATLEEHVRTQHLGLAGHIRPSRLRNKVKNEEDDSATPVSSIMDVDEPATPQGPSAAALAILTGQGYEESRPLACLVDGCRQRFSQKWDLAPHLELTHGWQIDDVNDSLAEMEALEGGKFWVGGAEEAERDERMFERNQCDDLPGLSALAGFFHGEADVVDGEQMTRFGVATETMGWEKAPEVEMVVDPALMQM